MMCFKLSECIIKTVYNVKGKVLHIISHCHMCKYNCVFVGVIVTMEIHVHT